MIAGYGALLLMGLILVLVRDAISEMVQEELATRLSRLPYYLLRLAALAVGRNSRAEICEEWEAELSFVLRDYDGLPVTRLLRGISYSAGFFRMMPRAGRVANRLLYPEPICAHPLRLSARRQIVKTAFDRLVALTALLTLLPLLGTLAVYIALTDGGPVLTREPRLGRGGRLFHLYRFRTTRPYLSLVGGTVPSRTQVTAAGTLLRRWSLDELPQLINVLRGDMSLVGPRPLAPPSPPPPGGDAAPGAAEWRRLVTLRLSAKPGITGLWQVTGRDMSLAEAVRLDICYVENWSLILDLQIMWKSWEAFGPAAAA